MSGKLGERQRKSVFETERDNKKVDRKATFERNVIEHLVYVRVMELREVTEKWQHLWYAVNL